MIEVPLEVEKLIRTVRVRVRQDTEFAPTSQKSMLKLLLMLEGTKKEAGLLHDKDSRLFVLLALTGFEWLASQKNLTQFATSVLIDEINNANIRDSTTLPFIEEHVKGRSIQYIFDLFPWDRPEAHMSDVQSGDTGGSGDARGLPF